MNIRTVVLNENQWMNCWETMCRYFDYIPSWDEYPRYLECEECDSTDEGGIEVVFSTKQQAEAFRNKWRTRKPLKRKWNI